MRILGNILDTSPIGRVADVLLLIDYSDMNILIVRQNKSKTSYSHIINELKKREINNCSIVINDIQVKTNKYGYGAGYGYGYGYGYGKD